MSAAQSAGCARISGQHRAGPTGAVVEPPDVVDAVATVVGSDGDVLVVATIVVANVDVPNGDGATMTVSAVATLSTALVSSVAARTRATLAMRCPTAAAADTPNSSVTEHDAMAASAGSVQRSVAGTARATQSHQRSAQHTRFTRCGRVAYRR